MCVPLNSHINAWARWKPSFAKREDEPEKQSSFESKTTNSETHKQHATEGRASKDCLAGEKHHGPKTAPERDHKLVQNLSHLGATLYYIKNKPAAPS